MGKEKPRTEAQIREDLGREFKHWDFIRQHGCSDPFWPDGCNLNLTRNHIIFHYRELLEVLDEPVQMSLFESGMDLKKERPIPPKVPENYMNPNGDHFETRIKRIGQMHHVTYSIEMR